MMFMVVFKCTRYERDGTNWKGGQKVGSDSLDCYMVSNKMFNTVHEAKAYAQAMPLSRQARVMDVVSFRCPQTGQWYDRDNSEVTRGEEN
jgi:hypothetical protein